MSDQIIDLCESLQPGPRGGWVLAASVACRA